MKEESTHLSSDTVVQNVESKLKVVHLLLLVLFVSRLKGLDYSHKDSPVTSLEDGASSGIFSCSRSIVEEVVFLHEVHLEGNLLLLFKVNVAELCK